VASSGSTYRTASSLAISGNEDATERGHSGTALQEGQYRVQTRDLPVSTSMDKDSFLELEDDEYHRVILPRRQPKPFVVPWPTLLPHDEAESTTSATTSPTQNKSPEPVVYLPSAATVTLAEVKAKRSLGLVTTPCDVLNKAVRNRNYQDANKLLIELEDLEIPIRADRTYIYAAVKSLQSEINPWIPTSDPSDLSAKARRLALSYLSHCPPVSHQLHIPDSIERVLRRLYTAAFENNHIADLEFTERLLLISASKGLMGLTIKTGLFKNWLNRVDVDRGYKGINEIIERSAGAAGISLEPRSREEAARHRMSYAEIRSRAGLKLQAFRLRNVHLRTLIVMAERAFKRSLEESEFQPVPASIDSTSMEQTQARTAEGRRYLDLAKRIFVSGQRVGIIWEDRTKLAMLEAIKTYLPDESGNVSLKTIIKPYARQRDHPDPIAYTTTAVHRRRSGTAAGSDASPDLVSAKRILEVVHARAHGPLKALADVLLRLEERGDRPSLLRRIENRFLDSPPESRVMPWKITATTRSYWYMAQVAKLKRQKRLGEAIALFRRQYLWVGLPRLEGLKFVQPVESAVATTEDQAKPKIQPSSPAITGILAVIVANLDCPDASLLIRLHEQQMQFASTYGHDDASTGMHKASHLPFIMAMTKSAGPIETQAYLLSLEAKGIFPGIPSWTAVATDFARRGYHRRALMILSAYRSGLTADPFSRRGRRGSTRVTSRAGNTRMFLAVAAMHLRTGRRARAQEVISLMRGQKPLSNDKALGRYRSRMRRKIACSKASL
jgi:hypothetical protein